MGARHLLLLFLLGGMGSLGWIAPSLAETSQPSTLGAGDTIRLYVSSHSKLDKTYQIDTQGEITLPFAGRVKLTGNTPSQAARLIARKLSSHYRGLSGVRVVLVTAQKFVWLRGWVKKPGRYLIPWNAGLEELLSQGGGPQRGARLKQIWLQAPGEAPRSFNLLKYYRSKKQGKTPTLKRNTVVFVPLSNANTSDPASKHTLLNAQGSTIAVLGAVVQPGVYPCFWKLNLMQALALAHGPTNPAALQEVLIVEPKKPAQWFDLKRFLRRQKSQELLPKLTPGSVLYIPRQALGVSQRGPIQVLGEVKKPGELLGTRSRDLSSLLANSGGPTGNANLQKVRVVHRGSNFTISQEVNLKQALASGRMDRLPPTPRGHLLVFVPAKRQGSSPLLTDTVNIIQLVVSITSVVTTTVILVITLNQTNQAASNTQNTTP